MEEKSTEVAAGVTCSMWHWKNAVNFRGCLSIESCDVTTAGTADLTGREKFHGKALVHKSFLPWTPCY